MTLPERIAHFRKKKGISQRKLAEILEFDPSAVGHWEQVPTDDRPSPVPRNMQALVDALGVTMAQFWSARAPAARRRAA